MKDDGVTQYHVPREQFERDVRRGYTVKKWQPSTKHRERDMQTGRMIVALDAPVDMYQCMDCQFNHTILDRMEKHIESGQHAWGFTQNRWGEQEGPYGPEERVIIDG